MIKKVASRRREKPKEVCINAAGQEAADGPRLIASDSATHRYIFSIGHETNCVYDLDNPDHHVSPDSR